ncbi:GNAT family N-acetyltransferase [Micromonospora siamensis]|uniref:Ribosomal protein S18 acetylase RimI n=1 Tax=Micromonospora siamensis TaxID=299152 RepID=A0A1C5JC10_9ACTN|nr:GNAT family N-acetyltransferase [Micromonospora siamensis]SCG68105.1 Ribosomal protein S18 acetylase RimI [Micromonospora siamensis]
MTEVHVRSMSPDEFDRWQTDLAVSYARSHVEAGNWPAEEALDRAREANAALLPQGMATPGMIFLVGALPDGAPVGHLWIGLTHPKGLAGCAYLYDIEVLPERRGQGLGRALLAVGEEAARQRGAAALELNVFGDNAPAVGLYRTSGYRVSTQQMRKDLRG